MWDSIPLLSHVTLPGFVARYLLVGEEAPRALVELVTGAVSWVTPKVLGQRVREVLNLDVRAELAQVNVPVLYLQPTKDKLVDPGCAVEMQAVKPGRTVMIDSPHLVLQCEAKIAGEAITAFVEELAG